MVGSAARRTVLRVCHELVGRMRLAVEPWTPPLTAFTDPLGCARTSAVGHGGHKAARLPVRAGAGALTVDAAASPIEPAAGGAPPPAPPRAARLASINCGHPANRDCAIYGNGSSSSVRSDILAASLRRASPILNPSQYRARLLIA